MNISSSVPELQQLLKSGLAPGKIIEWGLPQGQNGRILPIHLLRGETPLTAWVYPKKDFHIYPPSWASQGVQLNKIFFLQSDEPIKQLKPLFLEDTFKIIVLDSPKKMSKGDFSFLAKKVRDNQQILFLIRDYFLSPKRGNPFARVRLNCSQDQQGLYRLQFIKGSSLDRLYLPAHRLFHE